MNNELVYKDAGFGKMTALDLEANKCVKSVPDNFELPSNGGDSLLKNIIGEIEKELIRSLSFNGYYIGNDPWKTIWPDDEKENYNDGKVF